MASPARKPRVIGRAAGPGRAAWARPLADGTQVMPSRGREARHHRPHRLPRRADQARNDDGKRERQADGAHRSCRGGRSRRGGRGGVLAAERQPDRATPCLPWWARRRTRPPSCCRTPGFEVGTVKLRIRRERGHRAGDQPRPACRRETPRGHEGEPGRSPRAPGTGVGARPGRT